MIFFGVLILIEKVMDDLDGGVVLLVYVMNGELLMVDYGFFL